MYVIAAIRSVRSASRNSIELDQMTLILFAHRNSLISQLLLCNSMQFSLLVVFVSSQLPIAYLFINTQNNHKESIVKRYLQNKVIEFNWQSIALATFLMFPTLIT